MKKYVHVWFVILATLLAIVLGTTAQAHPYGFHQDPKGLNTIALQKVIVLSTSLFN
jgi:hypothetical protein